MERKNRLAVFEHVPHKERSVKSNGSKITRRARSPENTFEDNTPRNVKRRRLGVRTVCEPLMLNCEYDSCDFVSDNYYEFLKHIEEHLNDFMIDKDIFECMWENCSYSSTNLHTLKQHINFHGYHSKLKNIGSNLLERTKLPECNHAGEFEMPNLPERYTCEWDDCDANLLEYQNFLDHVKCHINANPKSVNNKDESIKCKWQGCINKYPTQYKLQDHVRTHTKERVVACPKCGFMFASKTKFNDHRKRQLSTELQGYQCSQCSKLFASERLLRDHMRIHINHYKCHLCDMTCPKPSMLAKHIRYRHLPDRPFKCDICSHSTISHQDLIAHRDTHNSDKVIECDKCDFKCRSKWTFERHRSQKHGDGWELKYSCHCCEKMFARGALLTKHLIKVHDFHWPSGHSRFLYKQDAKTGLYHLQVVRYESLEVTQEMIQGNAAYQHAITQNYKFECQQTNDNPYSYVLRIADKNQEQPVNATVKTNNDSNDDEPNVFDMKCEMFGRITDKNQDQPVNTNAKTNDNNDVDDDEPNVFDMNCEMFGNTAYESDDTGNLVICS